jgi:PAS domain S-box-containing protein
MPKLKRLLLLEDDPLSATLSKHRISKEWPDCTIVHASNKKDYTSALAADDFDVIISDYTIPSFSGANALSLANQECPETPFLFFSGTIIDEVAVESLKAGAVDYVFKDRPARLIAAINRALYLAEASRHRIEHRDLVNSVDGIVWQADHPSLQFIFVSQQAERILGYPIKSWIEEPDFWQNHIHPDDKEMAISHCRNLSSEQNHSDFEYRMLAADGRIVWFRDMVSVRSIKNRAPRIQGIMVDATAHKMAEDKVKDVQAKLEATNKDLLRRNEEIQNFYHVLSHELKTPLTSAREFVSMVIDGLAGPLNKEQLEYLDIAKDSCNQLRMCVNDLLDTTRIETGKLSLELTSVDLAETVQRIVTTLESKAGDANIKLVFSPPTDFPAITADENRLKQVVINLIENALKFTPSGGRITLEVEESSSRPDFVQVSISDTGRGIPKNEADSIFERLYQVKAGDATSKQGIGLGLYLCRELVWLHGGVIWVKSEVGQGSTFTFMLPKSQKRNQADVLLIDDNATVLETTKIMLATEYQVRTATDGAEGLKEMRRKLPDIVIMDLCMPNVDGVEMLKEIRANWDTIPVIVHTAFSNGDIMKRAMEYSPFTLLSKPCGVDALLRAVRHVSLGIKKEWDDETRIVDRPYFLEAGIAQPDAPADADKPKLEEVETH